VVVLYAVKQRGESGSVLKFARAADAFVAELVNQQTTVSLRKPVDGVSLARESVPKALPFA
jgi:hypothetical protein